MTLPPFDAAFSEFAGRLIIIFFIAPVRLVLHISFDTLPDFDDRRAHPLDQLILHTPVVIGYKTDEVECVQNLL